MNDAPTQTRRARLGRHLRRNVVGYVALFIAVSLTPLPSWAAATIGTADIQNNAVTTKKIKNKTVKKLDIAPGARGYTKIVTKTSETDNVASGAEHEATVVCGPGQVAIGGGGWSTVGGVILLGTTGGQVLKSHPTSPLQLGDFTFSAGSGNGVAPTGWRTTVKNTDASAQTVVHYAMCASK